MTGSRRIASGRGCRQARKTASKTGMMTSNGRMDMLLQQVPHKSGFEFQPAIALEKLSLDP
jgi:hypothetical protein